MSKLIYFILIIYLFNLIHVSFSDSNECVKIDSCRCEFANGTGINLNEIANKSYSTALIANVTYTINLCHDTTFNQPNNTSNECKEPFSICQKFTNNTARNLGKVEDSSFKISSTNAKFLVYKKNNIISTINLICTDYFETYLVNPSYTIDTSNTDPQINLLFFSPYACVRQLTVSHSMSTGTTLILIFFITMLTYFMIGILFNTFVKRATGMERIPNIDFWRDLPSLVRDGAKFIQNGCKVDPLMQTHDTYDNI